MNNQGQLENNSLAELVRTIGSRRLSGAIRLTNGKAKAVVYCEDGGVIFAASNLRTHRLEDFLRRNKIIGEDKLASLPPKTNDDELCAFLAQGIEPDTLKTIRTNHISDILRAVLLWTSGEWQFDSRVRVAGDTRVTVDIKRLLLESARHLPSPYITSRFQNQDEIFELAKNNGHQAKLLTAEAFVLSRVVEPTPLKDLLATSGMSEEETLRAVYGLALSGLLQRASWPEFEITAQSQPAAPATGAVEGDGEEDLDSFFARVEQASDYYEVLKTSRKASADEIRDAYHALARKYHPDRFHQSDPELRRRVDSAFASIARAYETLADESARAEYDARFVEAH
ncbi:MAG TPA: DnaJ domain-containing protein, partial [Pyrinomonadaceae bacterium]|nr:DnaJ domain-containing protein [Pyrinomonadaceae bacterium]